MSISLSSTAYLFEMLLDITAPAFCLALFFVTVQSWGGATFLGYLCGRTINYPHPMPLSLHGRGGFTHAECTRDAVVLP